MIAVLVAAAVATSDAAQFAFNPIDFFRGRTRGDGTLKVLFQKPKRIQVESEGVEQKDGTLVLRQLIKEAGKKPRTRFWRLRQVAPNRFEGTLTDAAGPVRVDLVKQGVRIRYTAPNHLNFDQLLEPAGPGEVHNHMRVRRFGVTVARLEEVIRKLD
ncbi:MAG TPA: DUF3833 family protein [Sphingomicrobium sp.]|jgi:hypothetical protein